MSQNLMIATIQDPEAGKAAWRTSRMLACSQFVPAHFRVRYPTRDQNESPEAFNVRCEEALNAAAGDCFLALCMAEQLGENPVILLQNTFVVAGRAGFKTEYMIARALRAGAIVEPPLWTSTGEGAKLSMKCEIRLRGGIVREAEVDMATAEADGWTKNAKYKSMPKQMLRWRSASMALRLYCPDVMLGYSTTEELETFPAEGEVMQTVLPRARTAMPASATSARQKALGTGAPAGTAPTFETQPAERERVPVETGGQPSADEVEAILREERLQAGASEEEEGVS